MFVLGFPLLLVPFVIYNIVAFIFRLSDDIWTTPAATIHLISGQDWVLSWQDILIAVSLLLLWVEIAKATRMGLRSIMDHLLAMALFVVMLVEFLVLQRAGTSTFFLLMMIGMVDVLAGFIVGVRTSQRQIEVNHGQI